MTRAPDGGWRGWDGSSPGRIGWGASFLVMLVLHAGAAVGLIGWQIPAVPPEPPPPLVMMELALLPASAAGGPAAVAPEPEPPPPEPVAEAEPEPPPPEPVAERPPAPPPPEPPPPEPIAEAEPPPAPAPDFPRPRHRPPAEPRPPDPGLRVRTAPAPPPAADRPAPRRPTHPVASPAAAAPAPVDPRPAQAAAAPGAAASPVAASRSRSTWQALLVAHLERHKRYPRAARLHRQQGVAYVRFTIDRTGNVLSRRLERSSGHAALDEETVELLQRASPLPAPPPEIARDRMEMVVPVQFNLR